MSMPKNEVGYHARTPHRVDDGQVRGQSHDLADRYNRLLDIPAPARWTAHPAA